MKSQKNVVTGKVREAEEAEKVAEKEERAEAFGQGHVVSIYLQHLPKMESGCVQ